MKALRSFSAIRTAVPKWWATSSPLLIQRRTVRSDTSMSSATAAMVKNRSPRDCLRWDGSLAPAAGRLRVMPATIASEFGNEVFDRLDRDKAPTPDLHGLELAGFDQLVDGSAANPKLIKRLFDRQQTRHRARSLEFGVTWCGHVWTSWDF